MREVNNIWISYFLHRFPGSSSTAANQHLTSRNGPSHRYVLLVVRAQLQYQVIGRKLPSEAEPTPKLFRMRLFAPNRVVAESRFWYFIKKVYKLKKAAGEIVTVNAVCASFTWSSYGAGLCGEVWANRTVCVDRREASPQGQELRCLDPLRLPLRNPQHVQGVPCYVPCRGRRGSLPGHGCPPPCSLQVHPHHPRRRAPEDRGCQASLHPPALVQGPQVPSSPPSPRSGRFGQEALRFPPSCYLGLNCSSAVTGSFCWVPGFRKYLLGLPNKKGVAIGYPGSVPAARSLYTKIELGPSHPCRVTQRSRVTQGWQLIEGSELPNESSELQEVPYHRTRVLRRSRTCYPALSLDTTLRSEPTLSQFVGYRVSPYKSIRSLVHFCSALLLFSGVSTFSRHSPVWRPLIAFTDYEHERQPPVQHLRTYVESFSTTYKIVEAAAELLSSIQPRPF
ncbi:hypothetical protein G7K_0979-t1 [Saitoella complicata NRRL Y-17804]|uniref:Uncharacterized protein n=1 Tax=Saitoella complicata (strain BCRC 22490 / CBS 7301 / JCM 7358 / NBRC 10748 / NRRL Y-17804) TaxID=698492 RepID=A0A0E9NA44_SAICN|nr:hypothetical protein G7K_0979-t1 [Saitoella complicata NRRL Y-17804]